MSKEIKPVPLVDGDGIELYVECTTDIDDVVFRDVDVIIR